MFPLLYHAHHTRDTSDLPFWLELASQQDGPILELGCGTGRVLIPLNRAGYAVCGLDSDYGMLSFLRAHFEEAVSPRIFQADMTAFHLSECFALILLPCNTWSTLSAAARRATLGLVRQHLLPGGLFAASLPNPALLQSLPARGELEIEEIFPHPLDGEPVQVSSAWQRTRTQFGLRWYYDHLLPDGRVDRLTVETCHALLPASTYQEELSAAGLTIQAAYGDFDGSPYSDESPSLILIARNA